MDDFEEKGAPIDEPAKGLTRRKFLKGAAIAGAAAGVASGAFGVPSALASGGSDWSAEDASGVVWDAEFDMIVIGSGYAGFCSTIMAYDALKAAGVTSPNILVIEKQPANAMGGNSILCNGSAQFAGTSIEKAETAAQYGTYIDTPTDTEQKMFEDSLWWGDYQANQDVLRAVVTGQQDTIAWLQGLGLNINPKTSFQYGMRDNNNPALGPVGHIARTHAAAACLITDPTDPKYYYGTNGIAWWWAMYNGMRARGFTAGSTFGTNNILTEHKATRFIQAGVDTPVVGLEIQNVTAAGGPTLNVRARRSVVIAAGGWKSNVAMRTNWDPRLDADFAAGGAPYVESLGEMIMAANDIGADLTGMDYVCEFRVKWGTLLYQHWTPNTTTGSYITQTGDATGLSMNFEQGTCVNQNGSRFCDEWTTNQIDAQDFCEAFANMYSPGNKRSVWAIVDDTKVPAAWKTAQAAPNPNVSPCVSANMIATGADLATLATNMGLNAGAAANLTAAIKQYNADVAAKQNDSVFGKPAAHMKNFITTDTTDTTGQTITGPFWAVKAQFFAHDQMSGITVNAKGQVTKRDAHRGPDAVALADQEVIERLYAAGEACGGYYGNERGHGKIGCIMNIARQVGTNAAAEKPLGAAVTTLALKASAASLAHGKTVKLTGTLGGANGIVAGSKVTLQVRVPGSSAYKTVGKALTVSAARKAVASYKLAKKGTYHFRMKFAGTTSFAASTSTAVTVVSK